MKINFGSILGIGGVIAAVLAFFLKSGRSDGPVSDDRPAPRPMGQAESALRTGAGRAHQNREAADDALDKEIDSRPNTDDPAADLRARLRGPGAGEDGAA